MLLSLGDLLLFSDAAGNPIECDQRRALITILTVEGLFKYSHSLPRVLVRTRLKRAERRTDSASSFETENDFAKELSKRTLMS